MNHATWTLAALAAAGRVAAAILPLNRSPHSPSPLNAPSPRRTEHYEGEPETGFGHAGGERAGVMGEAVRLIRLMGRIAGLQPNSPFSAILVWR